MPLNFNVTPYNDDFSEEKHFYRVLFKPTYAVQAREVTQLQTILQQQITNFGNSIYKHGSMVVPGQMATDPNTTYVILQPTFGMIGPNPIPVNLGLFTNQIIQGETSGVTAQVLFYTPAVNTDQPTLFVKYIATGPNGATGFTDGENIFIAGTIQNLATLAVSNATGLCISAQIDEGIYYMFGIFARVEHQYLLLNKYSNIVSCRIGLSIIESIVTVADDPSLADIAQGSPNYAAPGADRYKIDLILTSKDITDTSPDTNFVELMRLIDSVTQVAVKTDTYSVIQKAIAAQMFDTTGDFVVRNFQIDVREHLDTSFVTTGTALGGTAVSGPNPATILLATSASAVDGAYVNDQMYLSNGTGAGQTFTITGYTGSTKTAVLDENYNPNQVADTTTVYKITDPTKINRGIYPPPPYGPGDITKLAVGMESGRGYVDGFLVNTLVTQYVDVDKARDSAVTPGGVIQANVGNYVYAKNLFNIPIPASSAPKDFLEISLSNIKANGSFNAGTNQIGTARVHAIEFVSGTNQAAANAVFKLYLFDIQMNVGLDINSARSFYLTNNLTDNNNGNSENAYGDILAEFVVNSVNGTGLVPGNIVTGPNGIGTELIVSFDPINFLLVTEPAVGNGKQILNLGAITAPGSTTGNITSRTQLFDTTDNLLIYRLPQIVIKTVMGSDDTSHTSYYIRQMFEAQRNSSGQFIFNSGSSTPFSSMNTMDYLACIVASSNSPDVGKFVDLSQLINGGSFSGNPADTTLTIQILSGLGSTPGCTMKLMATIIRTATNAKLKTLTTGSLPFANPVATMSLGKADVLQVTHIWDSGNPAVDADPTNPSNVDIVSQYRFDNGQRDYFYDVGAVQLQSGAPGPAGRILIQFQYFVHSGTSDFFSVDSYTGQIDYGTIPVYLATNGLYYPLRDCLDFRPRMADAEPDFSSSGSSYSAAIKPNSVVQADFQYYLPRIDKIYADQYGNFNDISGTSALAPVSPPDPIDGMMLYTLLLNAYTFSPSDLTITATNNKGYTMQAIAKLETRIANLEFYTSLNELEQSVSTLQVTDTTTGLDNFKNGFVVDTFTGHNVGNVFDGDYECSVDPIEGSLRSPVVENTNTLIFNENASSGYVNMSGILMMTYTHKLMVSQTFATGSINVNPFAVFTFNGSILLDPNNDAWKSTVQRPVINVTDDDALDGIKYLNQWSTCTWGDWQTSWVGTPICTPVITPLSGNTLTPIGTWNGQLGTVNLYTDSNGNRWASGPEYQGQVGQQVQLGGTSTTVTTTQQVGQTRTGTQSETTVQTSQTINNSIVDQSTSPYIRSRRIKVTATHMMPTTRLYPFFDGDDVSAYCRPFSDPQLTPALAQPGWTTESILWGGDYSPQDNANVGVSDSGDQGETATYAVGNLNDPIFSDSNGMSTVFFEIPCNNVEEFKVGTRVFRLTSDPNNGANAQTWGDANYTASGIIDQNQETITSIETPITVTRTCSQTQTINNTLSTNTTTTGGQTVTLWVDPLAESFLVSSPGGAYITKVDVFFATADPVVPITMSIRTMENGYPSQTVVPFSSKTLYPNNPLLSVLDTNGNIPEILPPYSSTVINVSDDASVPTTFYFDCPVYLQDGTEYCIVLIANCINYNVYIATLGSTVIGSTSIVSQTPYLGSFFKSQNSSTWVADPTSNLKFNIYMAQFDPTATGQVYFTNASTVPDTLGALPFQTTNGSNIVRVYHPNHMMPKGSFSNSIVTLGNIAAGTYNGLTDVQLTGNFSIDNIDLDSYTIVVSGSAAVGTGRVGPDAVSATKNIQYDSICATINQLAPTGTEIDWGAKFTTGKSPFNNALATQEPYLKDSAFIPIPANLTLDGTVPSMIASDINETTSISGASAFDRKSLVLQGTLSTTVANLSPQIDSTLINTVLASSRIDDLTFANYTLDPMDQGQTVTSTDVDSLTFATQTILTVVGVTGGQFSPSETVTGAVSGASGVVVSWDSINLTLTDLIGTFQNTEAITGSISDAIGTVQSQQVVNTIVNPSSGLDFSVFKQGYSMTIVGAPSNQYLYVNPVVILGVTGNTLTVDTGGTPFVAATDQTDVVLTQYGRFVAESGPDGCSSASRYITRQLPLANVANSLQVHFTANVPPGSFIDVYYRTQPANSAGNFNNIVWTYLPLDAGVNTSPQTDPTVFVDHVYTANQIGSYTAFSIKLVMRGGNSAQVPRIQSFRAVALAT